MLRFVISLFIVLHGLVHLWYFTLSQRLVEFKPEMGWSGRSWIFTNFLGDNNPLAGQRALCFGYHRICGERHRDPPPRGMVAPGACGLGRILRSDHPSALGWRAAIACK